MVKIGQTVADLDGEQLSGWTQKRLVKPVRRTTSLLWSEEAGPCPAGDGESVSF